MIETVAILPEHPVRAAAAVLDERHPHHQQTIDGLISGLLRKVETGEFSLETMDLVPHSITEAQIPDTIDALFGYDLKDHRTSAISFIETVSLEIRNRFPHVRIADWSTIGRETMETQISSTPITPSKEKKLILVQDSYSKTDLFDSASIDPEEKTIEGFSVKEIFDDVAEVHRKRELIQTTINFSFLGWIPEDPELNELMVLTTTQGYAKGGKLDYIQKRISDGDDPFDAMDQIEKIVDAYLTEKFGFTPIKDDKRPQWLSFIFGQIEDDQEVI